MANFVRPSLNPARFSHNRPKLANHPLLPAVMAARKVGGLDKTTSALDNLNARRVKLGGYSPLGSGTVKYKGSRQTS